MGEVANKLGNLGPSAKMGEGGGVKIILEFYPLYHFSTHVNFCYVVFKRIGDKTFIILWKLTEMILLCFIKYFRPTLKQTLKPL